MIDKVKILKELKAQLENELQTAKAAYQSTHEGVVSDDLKFESRYDTRVIEASYLAQAQQKRVQELELEINLLDEVDLNHTHHTVSVGSLVEIEFNQLRRLYFICSTSGGTVVSIDGQSILVISAFSPIGREAIGLEVGDVFEVLAKEQTRSYQIVNIE